MIKKYWDTFSDKFGKSIIHPQYVLKRYEQEAIDEIIKIAKPDMTLVDIGCGRQPYRNQVESKVKQIIGIDHPKTSQKYKGKEKPDIFADASNIPLKKHSADIVSMISVLEHLPKPQEALKEASRLVKNNGVLILITVQNYPLHDRPYDFFRYTRFSLENMTKEAGFKIVKIRPLGSYWEMSLQTFNVYLLNKIRNGRKSVLLLLPFVYLLCLINNVIIYIINTLLDKDRRGDFAIYNLLIARKK